MTEINRLTCTNCGVCARACGGRIIRKINEKCEIVSYENWGCFRCGNCMAVCPSRSITVEGLSYNMFEPLPKQVVDFNIFHASLITRRSVRNYKKDPVPREVIDRVIAAAATAPMGVPPTDVEVLVIDRRAEIEELLIDVRKDYRGFLFIMGNPITRTIMRLVQGGPMYHALTSHVVPAARHALEESEKDREYFTYEAPVLMLFHGNKYKVAIEQDCFIAASYASIAAITLGLGSCFSGLIPPSVERSKTIRKRLGIPSDNRVCAGLMLGYPAVKFKRAIPRSFKSVLFRSDCADSPLNE